MFLVQRRMCSTCIYRPESPLDLAQLEAQVADPHGGFQDFRVCHHTHEGEQACCAGFWRRHRDAFAVGQIAQRLGLVQYVQRDDLVQHAM